MSLGDDLSAALPGLRAQAESMMESGCRIGPQGVEGTDDDLNRTVTIADPVYVGPCRVRFVSTVTSDEDAGTQDVAVQQALLSLPVAGSEGVRTGHMVEITANPHDGGLIGRVFRVTGYHGQTYATARRFPLELVT